MIMRTLMKLAAVLAAVFAMVSCEKSGLGNDTVKDEALQKANEQFVDWTVVPTYKALADECLALQSTLEKLRETKTDALVKEACKQWKAARQFWELSEAFLFGAASKYSIDPHIDTWPLDKTQLDQVLSNKGIMDNIDKYVSNFNNGLVGFHGLEYIIFREGKERAASDIPELEIKYAIAVSADLTLSACRLEAAWAGLDNVTKVKQTIIESAEMEPEDNFGEQMKLCGRAGSVWKSVTAGSEQILEGCKDIVDEVGNSKIGKPYTGEDENYIESPHSWNSITDFYDNIISVRNAYFGKLGATVAETHSVSAYIASVDKETDAKLVAAIENCLKAIDAMPHPFVKNYKDAKVKAAIDACDELNDALEAARKVLIEQ